MRIIFMGNPLIACPALMTLKSSEHEVVGVVSNAPKQIGRGRAINHTEIGQLAIDLDLNFIPVDSFADLQFKNKINNLKADLFVVVAFRILPDYLIGLARFGAINLHTSLLPKYRGAAPIQHAILNGEKITGISTFQIERKVDVGAIILQKKISIDPDDNFGSLSEKMSIEGSEIMIRSIDLIMRGNYESIIQDESSSSYAPKILKEMLRIDWNDSAENIQNKVRAFSPKPGAYAELNGKRFKIFKTKVVNKANNFLTGTILNIDNNKLIVSCNDSSLELLDVQLENKRKMNVSDLLKGSKLLSGTKFDE